MTRTFGVLAILLIGILVEWLPASGLAQQEALTALRDWRVSIDSGETFHAIQVPGTIERQIDADFDGISIYETTIPLDSFDAEKRVWLRFEGVATHAEVYVNDQRLGEHLGAWTPFEFDITDGLAQLKQEQNATIKVIVDERVGHNTQGFLPIVTNHFGGIWKPVSVVQREATFLNLDQAVIRFDSNSKRVQYSLPFVGLSDEEDFKLALAVRSFTGDSAGNWSELTISETEGGKFTGSIDPADIAGFQLWSPDTPSRYEFRATIKRLNEGTSESICSGIVTAAFCDFKTSGKSFQLNGQPVNMRGVLNWGYAPPEYSPTLDRDAMRREIEFAQERGFNLMKFCLWIPPVEYLELCEEKGMYAWIEYPTWHPQLDEKHLAELKQEYEEFFKYDRRFACVVLRSLTCETGSSADIDVIRSLYDQCKAAIPGAIVEDDSSWISWNRIHDFYDDHPYGNNHTWVETLHGLNRYVDEHEAKPLILGEAIAADSWTIPDSASLAIEANAPGHGPLSIVAARDWEGRMHKLAESRGTVFPREQLNAASIHYGMLMRKFQTEVYRREVPEGGYVVSVLRDFPKAAMGLIDFFDRPKNSSDDWAFQGNEMLLLSVPGDQRSFDSGSKHDLQMSLASPATELPFDWTLKLTSSDGVVLNEFNGSHKSLDSRSWPVAIRFPDVEQPTRFVIHCNAVSNKIKVQNAWPVWVMPSVAKESQQPVVVHNSANSLVQRLGVQADDAAAVMLASRFDAAVLAHLRSGKNVLMVPDGQEGSFPLSQHWFLRGSPVAFSGRMSRGIQSSLMKEESA
ncbi:MAG: hypothetical protein R3C03_06805 [Pirellulaceae bacterium]